MRIRRLRRPGEPFSDVINRLLSMRPRLGGIVGSKTITKGDWE